MVRTKAPHDLRAGHLIVSSPNCLDWNGNGNDGTSRRAPAMNDPALWTMNVRAARAPGGRCTPLAVWRVGDLTTDPGACWATHRNLMNRTVGIAERVARARFGVGAHGGAAWPGWPTTRTPGGSIGTRTHLSRMPLGWGVRCAQGPWGSGPERPESRWATGRAVTLPLCTAPPTRKACSAGAPRLLVA